MFKFIEILFSLNKPKYNTSAAHTQINKQASVIRTLFFQVFLEFYNFNE